MCRTQPCCCTFDSACRAHGCPEGQQLCSYLCRLLHLLGHSIPHLGPDYKQSYFPWGVHQLCFYSCRLLHLLGHSIPHPHLGFFCNSHFSCESTALFLPLQATSPSGSFYPSSGVWLQQSLPHCCQFGKPGSPSSACACTWLAGGVPWGPRTTPL